jgi:hypothetical protein
MLGTTTAEPKPASERPSRRPAKKDKRRSGPPPPAPAHSMSEALEGVLAAVGAPAPLPSSASSAPYIAVTHGPAPRSSAVPAAVRMPLADSAHLDHVLDGIDEGFERIVAPAPAGAPLHAPHRPEDFAEARAIFENIATNYLRPVRDFMVELGMGEPPRDWVQLCLPAMTSLRRSAEGMGLGDLCAAIDGFVPALQAVAASSENFVGGAARDALLGAYASLQQQLPGAFALDVEKDRREPIIVQSLLLQVKGVRAVALDKIYAAGLHSLGMFYAAKPEDVAAATGLQLDLSARIVQRFARYKAEAADVAPDPERSRERAELAELVTTLQRQNRSFQDAADDGSSSEKRRIRQERQGTVYRINVVLARLGEVERVERLERLPFDRKVTELMQTLEELAGRRP